MQASKLERHEAIDVQERMEKIAPVLRTWHRIYRASQLGIAELPAILITAAEEALVRIDPGVTPGEPV